MHNLATIVAYLRAYDTKVLNTIKAMLSAGVRFRDWKSSATGIGAVLAETARNFNASQSIGIQILATYQDNMAVVSELKITVDGCHVIHVVDSLRFDEAGQIAAIHAYLGRPDEVDPIPRG